MAIGKRIKYARLAKDMTLEKLSELIGVSRQTLCRYETGVIENIPSNNIEALAAVLGVTPAYLMGWENSVNPYRSVGENIKNFRKSHNLTQKDLSNIAQVTIKEVSFWESGNSIPKMENIRKIANHFCLHEGSLVGELTSMTENDFLLEHFENLNYEGRDKVINYIYDLISTGKYANINDDTDNKE